MPTDDSKINKLFILLGDEKIEFEKIKPINLDSECEEAPEFLRSYAEFEATITGKNKKSAELFNQMDKADSGMMKIEVSSVCDGTLIFAAWLIQALQRMGATNIKVRTENVENPDPAWMSCRFVATGIVWNTNNYRKMHGIPIKRRAAK